MGRPVLLTVEPTEAYRDGNPFVTTVVTVDDFESVDVRIEPPCYLNEAAVKMAGEIWQFL
jgi:hypothetical protein